ncbi:hypothetical protein [uncultured Sphingomonas sp.]|uniref:hypothetical protein n=1 Tax=uncultured Sphingomonas sp. TaxID=158754 RepID=UPI0025F1AAEE|nr:hypothetical protein [uncultured Sphingomonas sp.]
MPDPKIPTDGDANLSVDHQRSGDARRPSDTLDREQSHDDREDNPPRKSSLT